MKNKLLLLFIIPLLAFSIKAQESSNKFVNGLIIATKLNTIPPVADDLLSENLTLFEALPGDRKSFMRFIVDVKNESFFGYKMLFSKIGETSQYKLSFQPLGADFQAPQAPAYDYSNFKQISLTKYPEEIIVNDGDTLVLDLLENPKTGSKVQDLIKATTTESGTGKYFENVEPTDFSINYINLKLVDFKTLVNKIVVEEKRGFPANSHIIGFRFKDKGRFLLSAFQQDKKHNFQKIGYIENNKMFFKNQTDSFEIISKENILPLKGKWTLWGKYTSESEIKEKLQYQAFITEGYFSLDEPKVKPKKMVIKLINWY
jgi:hypothetical protein